MNSTQATASSNKGFTLVELIVVITILAILGTIGFLSLQGYSAESRDSKRTSDTRALVTSISTKLTEWVGYMSTVTSVTGKRLNPISVGGLAQTAGTNYEAGTPNYTALGMNSANFKDPTASDYIVGVTKSAGGAFQVAAKLENGGTPQALVQGNYNPRTAATITTTVVTTSPVVTIAAADIGKLKIGDTVIGAASAVLPSPTKIANISADGLTITLSATPTNPGAGIALAASETAGLIAGTAAANVVTDGTTTAANLPY